MGKRRKSLKGNLLQKKFNAFQQALNRYQPDLLEISPQTPNEIYLDYAHIDNMYIWLKNAYNDDLCVLCNEIRAILGHLSEYDPTNDKCKENLQKAYGHLRRLSIDTLKILCNGLDEFFDRWIRKHAYYDYSNTDNEYFPKYVTLYNTAHQAYIEVQQAENLGSDRGNNIIKLYHDAAKKYGLLYKYHLNDRRMKIEKTTLMLNVNKILWIVCTSLLVILSVLGSIY